MYNNIISCSTMYTFMYGWCGGVGGGGGGGGDKSGISKAL